MAVATMRSRVFDCLLPAARCLLPRGRRTGLIAFAVICALVIGGLGWATRAALGLEQEQAQTRAQAEHADKSRHWQRERERQLEAHRKERQQHAAQAQAEFAAKLRLALWRLDSAIAPVLAREDTRPYSHYSALFAPSIVLDSNGTAYDEAQLLEPSPLLNAPLPQWMVLHFQTTIENGWGSPQVPPEDQIKQLVKNNILLSNVTRDRRKLLREIAGVSSIAVLLDQLRKEEQKLANQHSTKLIDGVLQRVFKDDGDPSQRGKKSADYGYGTYGMPKQGSKDGDAPGRQSYWLLENSKIVLQNSVYQGNPPISKHAAEHAACAQEKVVIRLSPMTALWLEASDKTDRLAAVRHVQILGRIPDEVVVLCTWPQPGMPFNLATAGVLQYRKVPYPREVCQGILLDWPRLQAMLAAEVADLFPDATFAPVRDEVPAHPERTMTALPVEMDPGQQAPLETLAEPKSEPEPAALIATVEGWTPLRIGLALSWAAALLALGAAGVGGRSLIELSERRIRFVSTVTHELRTPLTTLRLYLDMLSGGLITDEAKRNEYLHTLHTETDRLNRLVSNVLDFSRLENQQPRLEKSPVLVSDLLRSIRDSWEMRCLDCGKELLVENGLAAGTQVVTDVHLVEQIVGNLIDNACKYSRGAEDPRLWLRIRLGGRAVVLEVEDRGPGVPPREWHAIFRPFCRGSGADVTSGGVGLGLALAQRWAQLLGGALTIHTGQGGTGARFSLELPGDSKSET
jgi:signal transduction histidine kinase